MFLNAYLIRPNISAFVLIDPRLNWTQTIYFCITILNVFCFILQISCDSCHGNEADQSANMLTFHLIREYSKGEKNTIFKQNRKLPIFLRQLLCYAALMSFPWRVPTTGRPAVRTVVSANGPTARNPWNAMTSNLPRYQPHCTLTSNRCNWTATASRRSTVKFSLVSVLWICSAST